MLLYTKYISAIVRLKTIFLTILGQNYEPSQFVAKLEAGHCLGLQLLMVRKGIVLISLFCALCII